MWTVVRMWTNVMMAIYELIPVDYGIYDAYMICIHDMHTWYGLSHMTEYRIGMLWYGIDCILCYTIQRRQTCMTVLWCWYDGLWCIYVFVYCFTYVVMWCLNVGYTCQIYLYVLLYCCNTITLHCMIYIV